VTCNKIVVINELNEKTGNFMCRRVFHVLRFSGTLSAQDGRVFPTDKNKKYYFFLFSC
jgi:hypothetical protein